MDDPNINVYDECTANLIRNNNYIMYVTRHFGVTSELHAVVPAAGLPVVGLRARFLGPEAKHAVDHRTAPGIVVPDVLGPITERPVRRVRDHGHRHRVHGGAHAGVRGRDQRAAVQGHVGHDRQHQRGRRIPVGIRAQLVAAVEASHAGQLFGARYHRRRHFAGIKPNPTTIRDGIVAGISQLVGVQNKTKVNIHYR